VSNLPLAIALEGERLMSRLFCLPVDRGPGSDGFRDALRGKGMKP
jgi:hypothetical protein